MPPLLFENIIKYTNPNIFSSVFLQEGFGLFIFIYNFFFNVFDLYFYIFGGTCYFFLIIIYIMFLIYYTIFTNKITENHSPKIKSKKILDLQLLPLQQYTKPVKIEITVKFNKTETIVFETGKNVEMKYIQFIVTKNICLLINDIKITIKYQFFTYQ